MALQQAKVVPEGHWYFCCCAATRVRRGRRRREKRVLGGRCIAGWFGLVWKAAVRGYRNGEPCRMEKDFSGFDLVVFEDYAR